MVSEAGITRECDHCTYLFNAHTAIAYVPTSTLTICMNQLCHSISNPRIPPFASMQRTDWFLNVWNRWNMVWIQKKNTPSPRPDSFPLGYIFVWIKGWGWHRMWRREREVKLRFANRAVCKGCMCGCTTYVLRSVCTFVRIKHTRCPLSWLKFGLYT